MIYTVTLNPALDKTAKITGFRLNEVNRIAETRVDAGGKGINVARSLAAFGSEACAVVLLAGREGKRLEEMLKEERFSLMPFYIPGETRTNLKVVDQLKGTYTDINEPGAPVNDEILSDVLDALCGKIQPGDWVVLSGSLPPGAGSDTYGTWCSVLKKKGAKVFLDADGPALKGGLKGEPTAIKPNRDELARLTNRRTNSIQDVISAAREIKNVKTVVVSMGGDGAFFCEEGEMLVAQSPYVPVKNTVGAGDSMVAAMIAFADKPLEERAALGVSAGAAAVALPGTQAADKQTVLALREKVTIKHIEE